MLFLIHHSSARTRIWTTILPTRVMQNLYADVTYQKMDFQGICDTFTTVEMQTITLKFIVKCPRTLERKRVLIFYCAQQRSHKMSEILNYWVKTTGLTCTARIYYNIYLVWYHNLWWLKSDTQRKNKEKSFSLNSLSLHRDNACHVCWWVSHIISHWIDPEIELKMTWSV